MAADLQTAIVEGLIAGGSLAGLSLTDRERALVVYSDKLTQDPASVRAADVDALRSCGLDDLAIHDACAIVAYFAFVNRMADGLGVELEEKPAVDR